MVEAEDDGSDMAAGGDRIYAQRITWSPENHLGARVGG
jgi:hypothetical protein